MKTEDPPTALQLDDDDDDDDDSNHAIEETDTFADDADCETNGEIDAEDSSLQTDGERRGGPLDDDDDVNDNNNNSNKVTPITTGGRIGMRSPFKKKFFRKKKTKKSAASDPNNSILLAGEGEVDIRKASPNRRPQRHHHHHNRHASSTAAANNAPPIAVATSEEDAAGGEDREHSRQYISHLFGSSPNRERGLEPMDAEMEAAASLQYQQQKQLHSPQTNLRKLHQPHGHHHHHPPHHYHSRRSPHRPSSASASATATAANSTTPIPINNNNTHHNHHHHHHQERPHRRKNKRGDNGRIDGYENSGHETSDFYRTEDDSNSRSDYYLVSEDDNDDDDDDDNNAMVGDDGNDDVVSDVGGRGIHGKSIDGHGNDGGNHNNTAKDGKDGNTAQDKKEEEEEEEEEWNKNNGLVINGDEGQKVGETVSIIGVSRIGASDTIAGDATATEVVDREGDGNGEDSTLDDIQAAISKLSLESNNSNNPNKEEDEEDDVDDKDFTPSDLGKDSTLIQGNAPSQAASPSPQSSTGKQKRSRQRSKKSRNSLKEAQEDASSTPMHNDDSDDDGNVGNSCLAGSTNDKDATGEGVNTANEVGKIIMPLASKHLEEDNDNIESQPNHQNERDTSSSIDVCTPQKEGQQLAQEASQTPQSKKRGPRKRTPKKSPKKVEEVYSTTKKLHDNNDDLNGDNAHATREGGMEATSANISTKDASLASNHSNRPDDDENGTPPDGGSEKEGHPTSAATSEPQMQEQNVVAVSSPSPQSKKSRQRRRTPKKSPKSVDEGHSAPPVHKEEEDEQHHQQTQTQTPQKEKTLNHDLDQHDIDNEQDHDPHEDDDDYPATLCTVISTHGATLDSSPIQPVNEKLQRTMEEEMAFLKRISPTRYQVQLGFVPNMKVPAEIIVNNDLQTLLVQELHESCCGIKHGVQSFIPALRQAANVAALPGIVKASLAMPDVHSGYGFCIGNVAAFDMDDPMAVISPGGVGFDINCGVRLIRTNLTEKDVNGSVREELADAMFRNIPVGVGVGGVIPCTEDDLEDLLVNGIDWAIKKGYAWEEDKEHCEENGRMDTADPKCVSRKAKKRGLKQLGTLGAGNHYAEIQVVDEIYHPEAANTMGIGTVGQVCIMIHTGSRGLGHQVATDALTVMENAMSRDNIALNDLQLSCARIQSREGKEYLAGMSAAANFAWVNRSCITFLTRKVFSEVFNREADDMDMHLVYDVCHNIAKVEKHIVDGVQKTLLVHRKGSTRAFPPMHPNIPKDYQSIGQPVLIGGTMGTCSYVLVGTQQGMTETFGSTCHGAGRALSRNQSRKKLDHEQILNKLREDGISIRVASPKLITEEAPESYKNVCAIIETCQEAGISEKVVKLRPIAVIKG